MKELKFRQIHMDFHTSEKILSVGEAFDAEKFASTLERARVNSVTCFARCHHGMLYYHSKAFPELIHPGLKDVDLLSKQIDACHERGILVPVYTTVQWDYHTSKEHPEWVCMTPNGAMVDFCSDDQTAMVYEAGFYKTLCVNTPYRNFLKRQIQDLYEVLTPERVDGLFLDIVNVVDCSCKYCLEGMLENGYNPVIKEERIQYARKMITEFKMDMSAFIRKIKPDGSIFYNAGHINSVSIDGEEAYSHWELESLPSGFWGYSHFSNTVRFARTTQKDFLTQTGKFHTEWGDFHSFKNKEALQYECFRMLAYNSKCLIGDQLDPNGDISDAVYDLVQGVYSEVEKKELWCTNAKSLADIAVFTSESLYSYSGAGGSVPDEVNGVCTMLDEMGYQLDIVELRSDLSPYKVLILPDTVWCDEQLTHKVNSFVAGGGSLIVTGESGLNKDHTAFALDCLGVTYIGMAPYSPDFIMPNENIGKILPQTEHVMYLKGVEVEAQKGSVLADAYIPYFNRTWEHFCSHRHTPSKHEVGYPAVVENGNCIYFAHPVFAIYQQKHPKWCKEIVKDAIERVLPNPLIKHNGPTTMITTINEQEEMNRYVIHALHYVPIKASKDVFTIEDIIPLYNIQYTVHLEKDIKSVKIVPEQIEVQFVKKDQNTVIFTVPQVYGHCMIELTYEAIG